MNFRYYTLIKLFVVVLGCFLIPFHITAQGGNSKPTAEKKLDSLLTVLETAEADTNKVQILGLISLAYRRSDPERSLHYSKRAVYLAETLDDRIMIMTNLSGMAVAYHNMGNYEQSLNYYKKSLEIAREISSKTNIAKSLGNIGNIYRSMGIYEKALDYTLQSLKIFEESGYINETSTCLNNLGIIYYHIGNLEKAMGYFHKALEISEKIGDKRIIAKHLHNIGSLHDKFGKTDRAIDYLLRSLKIREEISDKFGIASTLNNIAGIYYTKGEQSTDDSIRQVHFNKAVEYDMQALDLRREIGDQNGIATSLFNIGDSYSQLGKTGKAIKYLNRSLDISEEADLREIKKVTYGTLSKIYSNNNNYKEAYKYQQLLEEVKDSLFNEEKSKEIGKLEAGFEYDKKLALEQAEHEKQSAVAASESKRQKVVIYAVSGGLLLLIVFFILLFNRFRTIRRQKNIIQQQKELVDEKNTNLEAANVEITMQKKVIETKNKDITDSIHYAQNIQKAILPPIEEIKKTLPDSFVLFKPKDIVSGDFYFYAKVRETVVLAACDCTGHGVPGAFMSIIGSQLLNEIVNDKSVTDAAEVLNQLRDGVIHAFGKAGATGEQKDGMDMALCVIDRDKDNGAINLQYAGAYNPLYLIREDELQQIKADKQPVGYHYGEQKSFTNHEIQLQKGDTIYIFSDGYQDQFGGPRGKKFMSKRFRQLFLDIQEMNMKEQKEQLDKTIEDWKEDREQVDDILVIGVKI